MKLIEILSAIGYTAYNGNGSAEITGVEYDSRRVKKGSLFVCIKGFKTNGHQYIKAAIENGAAAVIITDDTEVEGAEVIKVKNARTALAKAACTFYNNPSHRLKIIGVTGTNGKTTVTHLIKGILELLGKKTGLIGTNDIIIGGNSFLGERTSPTTPEAPELQMIFNKMLEAGDEYCIMEVSSHALELSRVEGTVFEVGVFTNLTHEHLELHHTMENYQNAKAQLFKMCKMGVVNTDDQYTPAIIKDNKCSLINTYGVNNPAQLRASEIKLSDRGIIYTITTPFDTQQVKIAMPGMFSVYNSLAAITACLQLGLSLEDIIKAIRMARGAKGRAELVAVPADFKVMIDYAHTPDGLYNILTTLKSFVNGKIITVFGCPGDRDATKRAPMGKMAGELSDYCVLTSDNPASEDPMDIIKQAEVGLKESGCDYIIYINREEAIIHALSIAKEGDIVLLAGKGHEDYQLIGNQKQPFNEKDIIKMYFDNIKL